MKKILLLLALLPLMASAQTLINGIYYNLDIESNQAMVTSGSSKYTGSVTIPESFIYGSVTYSVTAIGRDAFYDCSSLTEVTIPNSVTSIGESAFMHCSNLTTITIPSSITILKRQLFNDCTSLESVVIPNSVTEIESLVFYKCSSLKKLFCYAKNIPTTNIKAFNNTNIGYATLYVPSALIETYKATTPWSGFGSIVALDNEEPTPVDIAINETNFPDENFRNWILERYGSDGVLTDDEIASADKISFPDIRVQSLKGIEYFTALGTLYFCDSPITTLDVSKNTELTYLGCPNCQLTSLDVSKNTKLTSLYCNGNNLTSLDVSQNTALKNLAIYNNQIKGAKMDTLVESLPTVSSGTLYAIYNTDEQNEMTTTQVATALAKGWTPKYMVNGRWQDYAGSEPEVMKCATPVVAFYDGTLVFMCETEDVEYKYQIATPLMSESDGTNVSMPTKIQLIIYATKDGYEPSNTVTKEIDLKALIGQLGDVNGDGEIGMADIMYMVQYILNGKFPNE